MSGGVFRRDWLVVWALMVSVAAAEFATVPDASQKLDGEGPDGRIFLNNLNSTLIPLGTGGALLASTLVIVAIVIGAVLLFSVIFNPHALKGGQGLFGPWFGGGFGGYQNSQYQQGGGQYYAPQTQSYLYEPYSKLGYQTPSSR